MRLVGAVDDTAVRVDVAALLPDDETAHVDVLSIVHHGLDQARPVATGHADLAGRDSLADGGVQAEVNPSVHHLHDARRAEHADPLAVHGLGHAHPADHHAPALGVHRGLRRVEVVAVVDGLGRRGRLEVAGLGIEVGHRPDGRVDHAGLLVHGRGDEDVAPVDLKDVGALAHPAIGGVEEGPVHELPVVEVLAAVEENLALFAIDVAAQDQVPGVLTAPDLGVARVRAVADRGVRDGWDDHALLGEVVEGVAVGGHDVQLGGRQLALDRLVDVVGVGLVVVDTRIEEVQLAILLDRAAGEAAVLVLGLGREERDVVLLPAHEILAGHMAPADGAPGGRIGEMLVEEVVLALVVDEAVGVVHPAFGGMDVYLLHACLSRRRRTRGI